MARNGDELPRWVQIIIAAIIVGVIIWVFVPKPVIWVVLGVAIVILGVVAYLAYKRQGIAAFTSFVKRAYNWLIGTEKRSESKTPVVEPLSSDQTDLLIAAVRDRCENPNCHTPQFNLEVHHIKPREQGGTNSVWNLIVLCHSCHGWAQKSNYKKSQLNRWIRYHSRERRLLLHSGKWKYHNYH
jgi:hypothetical protein